MNRRDPRFRQTLDRLTSTLESAQTTTQTSLFTFTQAYIDPCLSWTSNCLEASCYPCFGAARDRQRARRTRRNSGRGRPEFIFDFYNNEWEEEADESTGLLSGWGTDELERLIAGAGTRATVTDQPKRSARMNYGTKRPRATTLEPDPTAIPSSRMFGFLDWLPFKIGSNVKHYDPDSADLVDHPGQRADVQEGESSARKGHGRKRSGTASTQSTQASLSSRGDLFPSDDEDAVLVDDDFAFALERRLTSDASSKDGSEAMSRMKRGKRASHGSRTSGLKSGLSASRTLSSESTQSTTQMSERHTPSPLYDLEASLGSLRRENVETGDADDEEKDEDESPLLMKERNPRLKPGTSKFRRRDEKSPTPSGSKRRSRVAALRTDRQGDYFSMDTSPGRSPTENTAPGSHGASPSEENKES